MTALHCIAVPGRKKWSWGDRRKEKSVVTRTIWSCWHPPLPFSSSSPQRVEESSGDPPLVSLLLRMSARSTRPVSQPYDLYLLFLHSTACFNSLLDLYSEDDMQHMTITCACFLSGHCWTLRAIKRATRSAETQFSLTWCNIFWFKPFIACWALHLPLGMQNPVQSFYSGQNLLVTFQS